MSSGTLNVYGLVVVLIAAYWLWRVAAQARLGSRPVAAWWALPGLAALALAQTLDVPALLGVGAALLLYAEFWPGAFRRNRKTRPRIGWPLVALVMCAALLRGPDTADLGLGDLGLAELLGLLLGVGGVAGVLLNLFWPRRRVSVPAAPPLRTLGFETRWNRAVTPEWPELSLSLTDQGARLRNESPRDLLLSGWSPAGLNAWLPLRDHDGAGGKTLRAGQEAFLPLSGQEGGVRVWYRPESPGAAPHLFRADWTPTPRAGEGERVLN